MIPFALPPNEKLQLRNDRFSSSPRPLNKLKSFRFAVTIIPYPLKTLDLRLQTFTHFHPSPPELNNN